MFFNFIIQNYNLRRNKNIIVRDLGKINFEDCFDIQKELQNEIIQIKLNNRKKNLSKKTPNYLLVVEHDHVYTLGRSGNKNNLLYSNELLNKNKISYFQTNRGGDITYHGPGQIVLYPILDLENFFTDIHKYLRLMESSVINTLKYINILSSRNPDKTGVWLDVGNKNERKICAMGVKVSRWVTMHGLALNASNDLSYYEGIIPCGLKNSKVTSIKKEIGDLIYSYDLKKILVEKFGECFSAKLIKWVQLNFIFIT